MLNPIVEVMELELVSICLVKSMEEMIIVISNLFEYPHHRARLLISCPPPLLLLCHFSCLLPAQSRPSILTLSLAPSSLPADIHPFPHPNPSHSGQCVMMLSPSSHPCAHSTPFMDFSPPHRNSDNSCPVKLPLRENQSHYLWPPASSKRESERGGC